MLVCLFNHFEIPLDLGWLLTFFREFVLQFMFMYFVSYFIEIISYRDSIAERISSWQMASIWALVIKWWSLELNVFSIFGSNHGFTSFNAKGQWRCETLWFTSALIAITNIICTMLVQVSLLCVPNAFANQQSRLQIRLIHQ